MSKRDEDVKASPQYSVDKQSNEELQCLSGWQYVQLGKFVDLISGHHVMACYCNNQGVGTPYLTGPADFPDGVIQLTKYTTRPSAICDEGDILVTVKGSGVGSLALADKKYCISRQLMAVRVRSWDARFVYQLISSKRDFFSGAATGLIPGLSRGDILEKIIHVPVDPEEQVAIANALSDVDSLISSLESLITKKQAIKTATVQQLLTGRTRLPQFANYSNGRPKEMRQTELGRIPEDWVIKSFKDCVSSTQLGGNYANNESENQKPLIKMGNLGRGRIVLDKLEYVVGAVAERDRLRSGDVIFNTRNTLELVGKVAIWRGELPRAYFNSNLMRICFDSSVVSSGEFMNALLNTEFFISALASIATGTTSVAAIYTRDLMGLMLALPLPDEQVAIANVLSDIEAEIQSLELRLIKTRDIKQGMMYELLTGRNRLA
ncbi:hypothetical protein QCBJ_04250 [Pseudomonas sp. QC2]|uniref:restriction endonuclease subunit S n=1 Tax=Pseudomonas sp. QC2 TaxID=2065822 RepID=UPI000C7BE465|nr:restriction endonuclease subunit S [Pseudomonas sp. QC2]PLR64536.1 hypothetical protein QCBJ_04250 [Pseudomonas sp. QC2]